ncbi:MAG: hypothetical protein A3F74_16735 [Betaproteobacteria bacterium RIFCSPLOWO2_12_FULL_62_58]|nr:MAG: hypothetical protein A3F74_16735 [Betaproteobacteria bacterium RIFCSPLOWO2_12_FULL_62_58]
MRGFRAEANLLSGGRYYGASGKDQVVFLQFFLTHCSAWKVKGQSLRVQDAATGTVIYRPK